jgi:hypothetical protein
MKRDLLLTASVVALLSASPLVNAQSTTSSNQTGAAPPASATGTTSSSIARTGRADAKPVQDLEAAAQRLRDATHAMADAPAGPKRNEAIQQANRTLLEIQNAIAALPPEVITAAGNESDYRRSMDRLQEAAQRLRDAAHALAQEPVGAKRAAAMHDINKALVDTQQVMLDVPIVTSTASTK